MKRSNLFLLELVLSLLLFALCAAVCVGLVLHARDMSTRSSQLTQAVSLAQTSAESLRRGAPLPQPPQGYEIRPALTDGDGVVEGEITIFCQGQAVYTLAVAWPEEVSLP